MINFNTTQMESVSQKFFAKVKEQLVDNTLEDMCSYGDELMRQAYENRSWKNKTFNLKDSFGWVVYNNGNEYRHGYIGNEQSTGSKKIYGEEMKGRGVLDSFIKDYAPIVNGVELVIVAAMPYGLWLETRYNYEVLSSIKDELERAFNKPVKTITN
jgi:hypothetical protein